MANKLITGFMCFHAIYYEKPIFDDEMKIVKTELVVTYEGSYDAEHTTVFKILVNSQKETWTF